MHLRLVLPTAWSVGVNEEGIAIGRICMHIYVYISNGIVVMGSTPPPLSGFSFQYLEGSGLVMVSFSFGALGLFFRFGVCSGFLQLVLLNRWTLTFCCAFVFVCKGPG